MTQFNEIFLKMSAYGSNLTLDIYNITLKLELIKNHRHFININEAFSRIKSPLQTKFE